MNILPRFVSFEVGDVGFDDLNADGQPYDALGRKETGKQLSELLERIDDPLVLALDGGWGSGKSHFLRLWTGAHQKENGGKAHVIYFDAFEQDYLDDPLISLVSAVLGKLKGAQKDSAFKKLKRSAIILSKPAARIGLALATAGASELVGSAADAALKAGEQESNKAIDAFWEKENKRVSAMKQFRDALEEITSSTPENGKLIFIIDELDRCRPDYALSLLEIVKHFFAVPKVHFVLGTNLTSLEHSVTSRYGAGIDSHQYLRRFIHLRVSLLNYSGSNADVPWRKYWSLAAKNLPEDTYEKTLHILQLFSRKNYLSLRNLERLSLRLKLLDPRFDTIPYGFALCLITAAVLDTFSKELYSKARGGTITISELLETFDFFKAESEGNYFATTLRISWQSVLGESIASEDQEAVRQFFGPTTDKAKALQHYFHRYFDAIHVVP